MTDKAFDTFLNENGLVYPKTAGRGIKVDQSSPSWCWQDLLGTISAKGGGATAPAIATWKGNIRQFQFAVNDEQDLTYHIPHDWVSGHDCYIHVHWSIDTTEVETCVFGIEATYAIGHNQAAATTNITTSVSDASPGVANQIVVSEVQLSAATATGALLDSDLIEPDGSIITNLHLTSKTGTASPFIHHVDIHYLSTSIGTVSKVPNFYV